MLTHTPCARSERGITMLEVTLTATLSLLLLGAVLGVFDTFLRAESRFEDRLDDNAELQAATEEFARDARSAATPWVGDTSAQMAHTITVPRADSSGATEFVRWAIGRDGTLTRAELRGGRAEDRRQVVSGLDPSASQLRYYDSTGRELVAGTDPATLIAQCSVRVELELTGGDSSQLGARSSAVLRNAPAGPKC